MVLKLEHENGSRRSKFENDVKMYGTQAKSARCVLQNMFENDVKMYGTQATIFTHSISF